MPTDHAVARDKRYLFLTEPVHIVGRDWCFEWLPAEIETVLNLWNSGYTLTTIARRMKSTPRDTFLLLMELAEHGKIRSRAGYLWGVQ